MSELLQKFIFNAGFWDILLDCLPASMEFSWFGFRRQFRWSGTFLKIDKLLVKCQKFSQSKTIYRISYTSIFNV